MGSLTQEAPTIEIERERMHQANSISAESAGMFAHAIRGESLQFEDVLDVIQRQVPFTTALIVTTMPRGGLQIAQPQQVSIPLLKAYGRELHLEDRATWKTIQRQEPLRGDDCWDDYTQSRFFRELLQPHGLMHLAAAPIQAPVLEGYAGALHLYRSGEQGEFTAAELRRLAELARQLQDAMHHARRMRRVRPCLPQRVVQRPRRVRQFIFDQQLNPQLEPAELDKVDSRIRSQMLQHARHLLQGLNGQAVSSDRLTLPDSHGDLWVFRVVVHRAYPALGAGPFVFFCLQPECRDWSALRSSDFHADNELARLVPAVRFMEQEFHRSPTLGDIARTVHLSPFHFHRRFTELLGITPKHFLLSCQIEEAKRQLLAREKDLAQIASDCGFAHQSHFTSRFKQATGLTPTRWRRFANERLQHAGSDN